ncbi:MAG: hypothetical protein AAF843_07295 [Bacteroidota bacterium]
MLYQVKKYLRILKLILNFSSLPKQKVGGVAGDGAVFAANTYIKRVPESGRCIVILDNSSNFMFFEIESTISAVF